MKTFLLFFFLVNSVLFVFAQNDPENYEWEWANKETAGEIHVDSAGNIFNVLSVRENQSITIRGHTFFSRNNPLTILIKHNSKGDFIWVRAMEGVVNGVTVDFNGTIYTTGSFEDTLPIGKDTLISKGGLDVFLAKYDSSGNPLFAKQGGGSQDDNSYFIHVSKTADIYITGLYRTAAVFETNALTNTDPRNAFIAKYDNNGNLQMLTQINGESFGREISTDSDNNIYLLAYYSTAVSKDEIQISGPFESSFGYHFLAQLDAKGNGKWGKDLGSNYYQPYLNLNTDDFGNSYITQWRRYSGFIVHKIGNNGDSQWIEQISNVFGDATDVLISRDNNTIYITGFIANDIGALHYFWKFSPDGNYESFPLDSGQYITTRSLGLDNDQNIYLSGSFASDTTFFGPIVLTKGFNESNPSFLAKLKLVKPDPSELFAVKVVGDRFCSGDSIKVIYEVVTFYDPGNIFIAELSNEQGDFTSPFYLGEIQSNVSGKIIGKIPDQINPGRGYRVRVRSTNPISSAINQKNLTIRNKPIVNLGTDTIIECAAELIVDAGNQGAYFIWNTYDTTQTITINSKGLFYVDVFNEYGCYSSDSIYVFQESEAIADYSYTIDGLTVSFFDQSIGATSWLWEFDKGSSSTRQFPVKNFIIKDIYDVCLTIENKLGCLDKICKKIDFVSVGLAENSSDEWLVFPNPASDKIIITGKIENNTKISIKDIVGRTILMKNSTTGGNLNMEINVSDFDRGIYFLTIENGYYKSVKKLILM
ncbi:MAG: T9SS type A sorting domain-containing protein [Bacteroidetes bacterium]|nr:T9SS type A sorting domain-containing protein [Bacteroidota bacterium]HET6245994.1 T9SS type A sorting domain-containing protein [Bacteroidia bacterium]